MVRKLSSHLLNAARGCNIEIQLHLLLLPLLLLSVCGEPMKTFSEKDRDTGLPVVCDRCAPGTFLRSACTASQKSDCAPCPSGSFTELWNHINKCLHCGVCGHNQVVKRPCTAQLDCQCECKQGFYFEKKFDICVRHRECPSGQGVTSKGTAEENTVCDVCPGGSYSDSASSQLNCTVHRTCDAPGQQLVLNGSTWHDSVCTTCEELRSHDGADYLREILPAFFRHQRIPIKRLRRLVHKLSSKDANMSRENIAMLHHGDLYNVINTWVGSATDKQLRELVEKLTKVHADGAASRLENKLQQIDSQLKRLCVVDNAEVLVTASA